MDRKSLRAMLLLRGFEVYGNRYTYRCSITLPQGCERILIHAAAITNGYNAASLEHIYVVTYPCWFVGVASIHGIKNFISTKKAWHYINKVVQSYE